MDTPHGLDMDEPTHTGRASLPRSRSPLRLASCGVTPWLPAMEAYAAKKEDLQLPAAGSLCPYPRSNSPGRRAQQVYGPLQELRRQRQAEDAEQVEQTTASPSQQQQPGRVSSPPPGQQRQGDHGSNHAGDRLPAGAISIRRCPSPPPTQVGWSRAVSPPHCPALAVAVRRSDKQLTLRRLVSSASAAARPASRLVAVPSEGEDGEAGGSSRGSNGGCVLSFGTCYMPVTAGAGACSSAVPGHRGVTAEEGRVDGVLENRAAAGPAVEANLFLERGTTCSTDACETPEPHHQQQQQQHHDDEAHAAAATSRKHVEWAEVLQPTQHVRPHGVLGCTKDTISTHSSVSVGHECSGASTALSRSSSRSVEDASRVEAAAPAVSGQPAADVPPAAALDPARILADLAAAAGMLPSAQVMLLDNCGRPHTCPATCSSGPLWDTPSCAPAAPGEATAGPCAGSPGDIQPSSGLGSRATRYTSSNREVPILGAACGGWTTCTLLQPPPAEPAATPPPHSHTSSMRPGYHASLDTGMATGTAGRLQSGRRQASTAAAAGAGGGPADHLDQATISRLGTQRPAEASAKAATRRTAGGAHDLDLPRASTKAAGAPGSPGLLRTGSRGSSPRRRRQATSLRQRATPSSSFSSSTSTSTLGHSISQRLGSLVGGGQAGMAHDEEEGSSRHQLVVPAYSSQGGYAYGIYESETGILYYD